MSRRIEVAPLPRIAALYVRVSSKQQNAPDKTSLATQEAGERAWAAANGWLLDERFIYRERHTGEELWERPELTRLREAARARSFGVVVCHSIERLSRDPIHLGILLDELARIGIAAEFVTERLDDSNEGQLIAFIKGYAGKIENERRRERQMRATRARTDRGEPVATGPAPYGYAWADAPSKTRYVINPATAPVVRRIFRDYAAGMTLRELAAALTAESITTPTGKRPAWDPTVIRAILRNSIYWGQPVTGKTRMVAVPRDQRAHYAHKSVARLLPVEEHTPLPADVAPALIDTALAAQVAHRLRRNQELSIRNAKDPESALLRGLIRCGHCGGAVHANRRPSHVRADGSVPSHYVCRNALRARKDAEHGRLCHPYFIVTDTVDAAVWATVRQALQDTDFLRREVERMRDAAPPGADDLAALDGRVLSLTRRIDALMATAEYAADDEARRELAGQLDLCTRERRKLDVERAQVAQRAADWDRDREELETLIAQLPQIAADIEGWDYTRKRGALIALKAEVTLHQPGHTPRAEVTIRLPLRGVLRLTPDASAFEDVSSDARFIFSSGKVETISGVQIGPGATPFTRMLRSTSDSESQRVKATMAPLVEE